MGTINWASLLSGLATAAPTVTQGLGSALQTKSTSVTSAKAMLGQINAGNAQQIALALAALPGLTETEESAIANLPKVAADPAALAMMVTQIEQMLDAGQSSNFLGSVLSRLGTTTTTT